MFNFAADTATHQTATADVLPDSYRMADYEPERRRHRRRAVRFRAEAKRVDHTIAARRSPRFAITVLDVSTGGIRATSRMPVVDGERLHLMMPPESGMPRQVYGKVIRCAARADGWSLAIRFDSIPAA